MKAEIKDKEVADYLGTVVVDGTNLNKESENFPTMKNRTKEKILNSDFNYYLSNHTFTGLNILFLLGEAEFSKRHSVWSGGTREGDRTKDRVGGS